jgi:hypothetical protein
MPKHKKLETLETPDLQRAKKVKVSPDSVVENNLEGFLRLTFPKLDIAELNKLVELCSNLNLGDPLLVLDWNDAELEAKFVENPTHTKVFIISILYLT